MLHIISIAIIVWLVFYKPKVALFLLLISIVIFIWKFNGGEF